MLLWCYVWIKRDFLNSNAIITEFADLSPSSWVCRPSWNSCWEHCFENTNTCSKPWVWHWGVGCGCQLAERDLNDSNRCRGCQRDRILWGAQWRLSRSLQSSDLWVRNCSSEFTCQNHGEFLFGGWEDGKRGFLKRSDIQIGELYSRSSLSLLLSFS